MAERDADWLRSSHTDPAEVATVYDDWAARYDADLRSWDYRAPSLTVAALASVQPSAATVLDVGCGTGLVGQELAGAGFVDVVGIDLSADSLERAKATGAYREVRQVDVQSAPIPFADGAFAALVCVGVMTYLPDTTAVVREFCRLVEPGGSILFTQRDDLWESRGCQTDLDALAAAGHCRIGSISEPLPYLPGSDELGDVPVRLVHLSAADPR